MRAQRNDEVVKTVAREICGDDDTAVHPVVVLCLLEVAVWTGLRWTEKLQSTCEQEISRNNQRVTWEQEDLACVRGVSVIRASVRV